MLLNKPALRYIQPAKPRLVDTAPSGKGWLHEVKFDGYRTQIHVEGGTAKAFSSSGIDWTSKYPQIVAAASQLRCTSAILDGEVYLPDAVGAADFYGLPAAVRWRPQELIFVAFDLLHLDGEDLRSGPIESRRAMLADLLQSAPAHCLAFSEELGVDGPEAFAAADRLGLEGIVSKRRGSRYKSGDTDTWLKTKAFVTETFEIIGVDRTDKRGIPLALLARAHEDGLRYAGDAIIALPEKERGAFWQFVGGYAVEEPPIAGLNRTGTWLPRGLAAKVRHLRGEEYLRHATLTELLPSS